MLEGLFSRLTCVQFSVDFNTKIFLLICQSINKDFIYLFRELYYSEDINKNLC